MKKSQGCIHSNPHVTKNGYADGTTEDRAPRPKGPTKNGVVVALKLGDFFRARLAAAVAAWNVTPANGVRDYVRELHTGVFNQLHAGVCKPLAHAAEASQSLFF